MREGLRMDKQQSERSRCLRSSQPEMKQVYRTESTLADIENGVKKRAAGDWR